MHNKQLEKIQKASVTTENMIFADEEHPGLSMRDRQFTRCLFVRIGLKSAKLDKVTFHRCVFVDCYLRRVSFHNVDLTGSFFKDCNLERATFESCALRYVRFCRCRLPYNELFDCLPSQPNIAVDLLKSLLANAIEMRDTEMIDRLTIRQINVQKRELKNRFGGSSEYYRSRYKGMDRLLSGVKLVGVVLSGWIWGHGMRLTSLFRSAGIVILAFWLLFYCYGRFSSESPDGTNELLVTLYHSIAIFTTLGLSKAAPDSGVTYFLSALESVLGVTFLGFLAAAVYRKFAR